jgi:hypothetical protein
LCTFESVKKRKKLWKKTGLWLFWSSASSSETERNYTSAFLSIMECFALCLLCVSVVSAIGI